MQPLILILVLSLGASGTPPDSQRLEELYKKAKQWGVGELREEVSKARRELATYGDAALQFLFEKKVRTLNPLELRVFKVVVQRNRQKARPYLHRALESENDTIRRVALWLIGEIKDSSALPRLREMLHQPLRPRMRARVLAALGRVGDTTAAAWVAPGLQDSSVFVRYAAAVALVRLHQPRWVPVYMALLQSTDFQLQRAGVRGLAREPAVALDSLEALWARDPEALTAREALALEQVLAALDRPLPAPQVRAWRARLIPLLDHPDPAVRHYVALSLNHLGGKSLPVLFSVHRDRETDPLVFHTLERLLEDLAQ